MSIEAELPDGTVLEFPDGTDPAIVQAAVKRQLGLGQSKTAGAVAPPPAAAAAPAPKPMAKPTTPLAGSDMEGAAGVGVRLADQLYRTFAGAAADAGDAATGLINRPINAVLDAVGVDQEFRLPVDQAGRLVAEPVGALPQFTRDIAPFVGGSAAVARGLEAAGTQIAARGAAAPSRVLDAIRTAPGSIRTGIAAGAPVDAAMASQQDGNLGNLIANLGGPTLPTARMADDSDAEAMLKDMAEGGALGTAIEFALKYGGRLAPNAARAPGSPDPAAVDPAMGPVDELPPATLPPEAPGAQVMDQQPVVEITLPDRPELGVVGRGFKEDAQALGEATPEQIAAADQAALADTPPAPAGPDTAKLADAIATLPEEAQVKVLQALDETGVPPPAAVAPAQVVEDAAGGAKPLNPEDAVGAPIGGDAAPPARAENIVPAGVTSASPRPADSGDVVPSVEGPVVGAEPLKDAPIVGRSLPEADVPPTTALPETAGEPAISGAQSRVDMTVPEGASGGVRTGAVTDTRGVPEAELKATPNDAARQTADEMSDEEIEGLYNRTFKRDAKPPAGAKLMSGVDPTDAKELLLDPAVKVVKKEIDAFKDDFAQVKRDFAGLKENASGAKALDSVARTGRKLWWSNTAAIRAVAAKHKDIPEVRQLADQIGTDPGRGRVVEQTYERAVQMRSMGMANRARNVMGEKVKPEYEARVADILAGRKVALGGTGEEETARRLRKLLDEQHEYLTEAGLDVGYVKGRYYPRVVDEEAVLKDPTGFKAKAAEVYRAMELSEDDAAKAAEDWYSRILGVGNKGYASGLPSSESTKGRTLPAEADEILKDFYSRDPRANLTAYFRQTSQAAEFSRRFGKNGEKVDELFNGMLKKGMDPKEVDNIRHHFESAAGLLYRTRPDAGAAALSWIQTAGVLRLLPRAVISSAAESLAVGIRAADVKAGFSALIDSYATVFGLREPDDVKAAAEMLGIIGDAMNDLVISANFGGEVGGQLQQKLLARFFKTTQLHQITEAQRLAAARVGQGLLRNLLQDVTAGTKRQASAKRMLAELGIPEADAPALSAWLGSEGGKIPFKDLLSSKREAVQYRTALQRFVDESIQNPSAADRPQYANHPYGRLAYGITSFMFSFTRNVLVRTARETGEGLLGKGYTLEDRARLLTPALMLGVLTAAQSQVSEGREALLNPGGSDEKTTQQKVVQNLSRAGLFGNADPFINIAMSARYNRDLTSTLTGPYLTAYLDSISKMTVGLIPKEWGGSNTSNTNNAEWQAAKAGYEMVAAPLIAIGASMAPGGPALRVGYGAGLISSTSPGASKAFADKVAGERTVKPGGEREEKDPDLDLSLD